MSESNINDPIIDQGNTSKQRSKPNVSKRKPKSKAKRKKKKKVGKKHKVSNVGKLKPKGAKLTLLSIDQKKQEHTLYMRIWRKKKVIAQLNKEKPSGWRTQRSKLYKELIIDNKAYKSFWKSLDFVYDHVDKKEEGIHDGVIVSTFTVWKFEGILKDFIRNKTYTYYNFINIERTYNLNIHRPSTIIYAWDEVLDEAYIQGASTPSVYVTEDIKKSKVTVEIIY